MSMRSIARNLGIHQNYFSALKNTNTEAFNYMSSLDESLFDAYNKYQTEQNDIKSRLTDVYYHLSNLSLVSQFSKHLQKKGYYRNWNGFSTCIGRVLFGAEHGFNSHKMFIKSKALLDEFSVFYRSGI